MDSHTRAIFVDLVLFNAYTNLFTIVKYVFEVPACGGWIEHKNIDSMRLYAYVGEQGLILIAMQFIWYLIFLISTIREFRCMCRDRNKYFKDGWNWLKMSNVAVVCGTTVAFVMKSVYVQLSIEEVKNNIGKYGK